MDDAARKAYAAHLASLDDKALYAEFVQRETREDREHAAMAAEAMEARGIDF